MVSDPSVVLEDAARWRPFELELPMDWENGYLEVVPGGVEFRYGSVPKRPEWEAKRWRSRLRSRVARSARKGR